MLRDLAPLFAYMRRYRWSYVWGTAACLLTNIVWSQFPRVLQGAINSLRAGTTKQHILLLAGLLVALRGAR